jgi:hypothetical protein
MGVYEGVLKELSEGEVISSEGTGGYWVHRWGTSRYRKTGVDPQAGWVRRQFLDVGDTRIANVVVQPHYDALLQEAVGQEIAVSMIGPGASSGGRKTVIVLPTPKGITRPSRTEIIAASIWQALKHVILAPILVLMALFFAYVVGAISNWVGMAILVAAVPILLWWLAAPFVFAIRTFRAAGAVDKTPWTEAAPTM